MKINFRKLGAVLALVFIVGLGVATVYSRSYAERKKALVQITLPETATLYWDYETRSAMRPATAEEKERGGGTEWVTEVTVPYEAYKEYMGELTGTLATLTTDGGLLPGTAKNLYRTNLDNGDVLMILGYDNAGRQSWDGEGVTVHIEHKGITVFDNLVPPGAIQNDVYTGEQYIYIVNVKAGAWGKDYFVQRLNVVLGMPTEVGELANIASPSLQNRPVVTVPEKGLFDGAAVRIFD